ncbi:MAG: PilW family protein [Planctomycetota bacterium]|jgi:prepilin-type N-terminal cleavage/methylation domain-containing protein
MKRKTGQAAFTLAEMLIALVILSMLMAAIATAVHASLMSYTENTKIATVTQTGRTVLNRITRDVRTAQAINYDYVKLTIIPPDDGSGITKIEYQHTGGELLYTVTKDGTPTTYTLIASDDEVQIINFLITQELGLDWQGFDCTKSITVRMELQMDNRSFTLSGTAAPRRNQIF